MSDSSIAVVSLDGTVISCAVCTILIGPGYHEQRVFRDRATGWRVCSACIAFLKRQRERDDMQVMAG
jgi:hypothetical protein